MLRVTRIIALFCVVGGAIAASFGLPSPAVAQSSAPPDIVAAYQTIDGALAQLDPEPQLKLYAPNAVFIDESGHIHNFAQVAASIRAQEKATQSAESTITLGTVIVQKSGVTVPISQKLDITRIDPKTGVLNTTILTLNERDHWVEVGGVWKINRERVISAFGETNGQPNGM